MATVVLPSQSRAPSGLTLHWRRLRRLPWLPIVLLAPVVICGIFGSAIFPHDPTTIDLMAPRKPPVWLDGGSWQYVLGTDQFGRDLLSRLMEGCRVALIIALSSVFLAALIGVTAGMVSGYYGGVVDNIIMRIADVVFAIPGILLIILIGGAVGGGFMTVLISIVLVSWVLYARVVRGETLVLRERGFVALARVANCSDARILVRHILPNLLPTVIVLTTLQAGFALLIEAAITFIGLGIQPPATTWGLLISEGRPYMTTAWWIPAFAGLAITITVLGTNLLGDWLQEKFDPRRAQR
ncbi:MAG TPA: ABC transporter permease [Stellaceae bacterium]|nr:ABC transporter permease [Stellaceae bacterium]